MACGYKGSPPRLEGPPLRQGPNTVYNLFSRLTLCDGGSHCLHCARPHFGLAAFRLKVTRNGNLEQWPTAQSKKPTPLANSPGSQITSNSYSNKLSELTAFFCNSQTRTILVTASLIFGSALNSVQPEKVKHGPSYRMIHRINMALLRYTG